jgi:hypothetical protein
MMLDAGQRQPDDAFRPSLQRFIADAFPEGTHGEFDRIIALCEEFERKTVTTVINLSDAAMMKTLCDIYFLRTIRPAELQRLGDSKKRT